jgi:TonB family protein
MIANPPASKPGLRIGFDAGRNRSTNPEAWKHAIGTKGIPARLALLPEGETRWNRLGISAGVQLAILLFFLAVPIFFPAPLKTALSFQMVPLATPTTDVPVAPPPKIRPKVPPPNPTPFEEAQLNPKQPHIFVQPKVIQPEVKKFETKAPQLDPQPLFDQAKIEANQPMRPKDDVKLNNFSTGSAAPATVNLPSHKVQTGGFGDPNGIPGKGDPNKTTNINRQGSPALPGGPGYGNGTGGDKGVRGAVHSAGFGNGIASPPEGSGKHGTVQSTGFADQSVATQPTKKQVASNEAPTTDVAILDKPRPEYTAEGRNLKLEGDVVLDVVFLANGSVQVSRLVSGLGHGLDEAAARAAERIKFKPAMRDGQPTDFPARVRIEFRLAY